MNIVESDGNENGQGRFCGLSFGHEQRRRSSDRGERCDDGSDRGDDAIRTLTWQGTEPFSAAHSHAVVLTADTATRG